MYGLVDVEIANEIAKLIDRDDTKSHATDKPGFIARLMENLRVETEAQTRKTTKQHPATARR